MRISDWSSGGCSSDRRRILAEEDDPRRSGGRDRARGRELTGEDTRRDGGRDGYPVMAGDDDRRSADARNRWNASPDNERQRYGGDARTYATDGDTNRPGSRRPEEGRRRSADVGLPQDRKSTRLKSSH